MPAKKRMNRPDIAKPAAAPRQKGPGEGRLPGESGSRPGSTTRTPGSGKVRPTGREVERPTDAPIDIGPPDARETW